MTHCDTVDEAIADILSDLAHSGKRGLRIIVADKSFDLMPDGSGIEPIRAAIESIMRGEVANA